MSQLQEATMTITTDTRPAAESGAELSPDGQPPPASSAIRWFETLGARDTDLVGGKGANLGELCSFGMPVPPGFVLTAVAFQQFLEASGLRTMILQRLATLNVDDTEALKQTAAELQERVKTAPIPAGLCEEVREAYAELAKRCETVEGFVAVRSSATAEDMPGTSFAGMNETFLNVRG
ncbi:MAG: PEP/pyruvate-binding domain-containing protein, partial [Actinomycetota bacterium]